MGMGRWVVAALATVAVGCGPGSVSGEVDGDSFGGLESAIFDDFDLDLGPLGSYASTVIVLSDVPDSCAVTEALIEAVEDSDGDCDNLCEGYASVMEDYDLDARRYWSVTVTVNTSDDETGEFDFDREFGEGEFVGDFSWMDGALYADPGLCESTCEDNDWDDLTEDGEDGSLAIETHESDLIQAELSLDFGGDDGMDARFDAEHCSMDDWF